LDLGVKGALASLLAARATCALFTLLNGSSHLEWALLLFLGSLPCPFVVENLHYSLPHGFDWYYPPT